MPSLIDIRRRIRSVKSTQQITKAMKMVSAAKLRRAQDRVIEARPYSVLLRTVLGNVAAAVGSGEQALENPLLARRPEQRILVALVTSDKGLAGAFNSNLIKGAQRGAVRARGDHAILRAAQLGGRNHLHGLGDLLRIPHRADAPPDVDQARHAPAPAAAPPRSAP